jgi:hypothetical protein
MDATGLDIFIEFIILGQCQPSLASPQKPELLPLSVLEVINLQPTDILSL